MQKYILSAILIPIVLIGSLFSYYLTRFLQQKRKGTGVSLATVYGIVKIHSGYIWVYSRLNQGTGYTDDVIADRGILKKGTNLIQKPFSMKALLMKVRETLDR